jgi:hypothetical protein
MALMQFYFSFPLSDTTTRNGFNLGEKYFPKIRRAEALSEIKTMPADGGEMRGLIPAGLNQTSFTTPQ